MARVDVLRSVRRFCLECQGESAPAVRACADGQCALWQWRLPEPPAELLTTEAAPAASEEDAAAHAAREALLRKRLIRQALRAVRRHCLNCAGDRREVRACAAREDCALWSLRFGVRPETYKAVRQRFFAPKKLSLL